MPSATIANINSLDPTVPVVGRIFGSFCGYCTAMADAWKDATEHAYKQKVPIIDLQTDGTGDSIDALLAAVNTKFIKSGEKLKYRTVPTIFTIKNGFVSYHTGERDSATLCGVVNAARKKTRPSRWRRQKVPHWKTRGGSKMFGGKSRRRRRSRRNR